MTASSSFHRVSKFALILGVILLIVCGAFGFFFPATFFEGYLTAFVFWVEIPLGCLALLLIQYLTGGKWALAITRLLEAGIMTPPLCAALFLPVLAGMGWLFPWTHPSGGEIGNLVHQKALYLNVPFYVVRYVLYFLVLSALAFWFRRLSLRRDEAGSSALAAMQRWSGPSLIVFVLLMNFACIDWVMSLNPEWYSSMLVVEFVTEQGVVAMAWCIVMLRFLAPLEPFRSVLTVKIVHDLGNLLLGFTCFWTYVTFMEYIITWTGNLPHEVSWFTDRSSAGWKLFAVFLVLVHFAIPLFCLILTSVSKNLVRLARVAALMLVAHFAQVVWWIEPAFGRHFHIAWTSLVLIVAVGAIWLAAYMRNLGAAPLVPGGLETKPEGAPA
jgi:uncharacterized membrane protein